MLHTCPIILMGGGGALNGSRVFPALFATMLPTNKLQQQYLLWPLWIFNQAIKSKAVYSIHVFAKYYSPSEWEEQSVGLHHTQH